MNGESTAPLPVMTPGPGDLLAVSEQVLAELEENRRLTRMAIAGQLNETALVMSALRLADLQAEWRAGIEEIRLAAVANALDDTVAGVIASRLAAVPQPRHRHRKGGARQRAPGEGQLGLFRVPSLVLVACAALKRLAPHAGHGAVTKAISLKAGLLAAAVPATGVLVVGAVVITHAGAGSSTSTGTGTSASVPGWHTSASPIPSSSLAGLTKPKPKAKRSKDGKTLLYAAGQPPYSYPAPGPSSSSASPSASASASAPAGDAALAPLTFTSLDLSDPLVPQVTFTLTATGSSGWVSWRIKTAGTDLDFSTPDGSGTHGVLNAGQSVVVTVTVDPAQAADGNTSQVFTVNDTQSVTVALPGPLPTVSPAPVVSDPLLPSPSSS